MTSSSPQNRLASESSAYLLQHAANPVDWYPWGEEALTLARELERPILLSIGYSACHWCHVMERESFENADIAALMNEHFVCIKVDREERPDIDHLYMKALQGMTGRGGWPMTMFLTPDAEPFYAGTYFPPEDRGGMPGFPRVLLGVSRTWTEKRDEVLESAGRMVTYLGEDQTRAADDPWMAESLIGAAQTLVESMDPEHGGFGRQPKFPGSMALSLLMEVDAGPLHRGAVRLALDRMAMGGIRDHLGGGFHRYSVDQIWLVPHFEKMLYDQALLARLYSDASLYFADADDAAVASEIFDYIAREMTSEDGGFYAAQDADSEGVEGKFFVWTPAETEDVLGTERAEQWNIRYGVAEGGNFEGASILHQSEPTRERRAHAPDTVAATKGELAASREQLLAARALRVAPATDRKIVADWNGLLISAMAIGGRILDREDVLDEAERAARFVRTRLRLSGELAHVYADGVAKVPAFLDDYAFFGRASLDLFVARPLQEHLQTAVHCADRLLQDFRDEASGGFFFTGRRGETLVARTCDLHDGAVPAGNSVAAELLFRLWALTGQDEYRQAAQGVLDRFLPGALRQPYGASHLLAVAGRAARGWKTVVIIGEREAAAALSRAALDVYDPANSVIVLPEGIGDSTWEPEAIRGKKAPAQGAWAYVCEGSTCSLAIEGAEELRVALRRPAQVRPLNGNPPENRS